jgi:hypothetical protein
MGGFTHPIGEAAELARAVTESLETPFYPGNKKEPFRKENVKCYLQITD